MSLLRVRGKTGTAEAYDEFARYDEAYHEYAMKDFSGGVMTGELHSRADTVSQAVNVRTDSSGALVAMSVPVTAFDGTVGAGEIVFSCYDDGILLFRKGNTLYAVKDGALSVVGTAGMLQSEKSAVYTADGLFCIIDGDSIYMVDRDLTVSTPEPYIPTCYTDVSADGAVKTESEKPNLFCRYIDIILAAESSPTRKIPPDIAVDDTYIRIWDLTNGSELGDPDFNFDGETIQFFGLYSRKFRVRLKLADSGTSSQLSYTSLEALRELVSCPEKVLPISLPSSRLAYLSFGGENGRWITALKMEGISDFLYLSDDNIIRKEYPERIASIVEYSDGYFVFSAGAVKKLFITEDENGVPVFEIKSFKNDFGSYMPGSICGFDDKILFANSRGGVYYINKFGISEKDVSRHISRNIEQGENGFFSHTEAEYAAACAVCAFGRYMLTVGDMTYIWDYTARLPSGTQSREDEDKMIWTMCDAVCPSAYLSELSKKLYYTDRTTGALRCFSSDDSESDPIAIRVETAACDFGESAEKVLIGLSVRYRAAENVTLRLLFDGEFSPCEYVLPPQPRFGTVNLKIHSVRLVKCAAMLECSRSFSLESVHFRYLSAKS